MAEYDLICDACGRPLPPHEAVLSWREDERAKTEDGFSLAHEACAPAGANARREGRALVWPNGYLAFFAERFSRLGDGWRSEPAALEALLHALAPFVMRPDNPSEMDSMRAASFGQKLGVKPGAPGKEPEGGK
jgi:hypothetical protein